MSIADLANAIVEALGVGLPVEIARPAVAGVPRAQYVPSVRKPEQELGLRVWVGLREAIRRTAAWHSFRL